MNQAAYRNLISGGTRGPAAMLLRAILRILSGPYGIGIRLRNVLYDIGFKGIRRVDKPVVSIGNITAGGTGKTPMVIWLCRYLADRGYKAAVLTRGYKSHTDTTQLLDEPALLAQHCPNSIVMVNPNRIHAAKEAIAKANPDVFVMDDGFQHRRLHRDINIVLIDATEPFGYDKLLPAGLLREPIKSLARADAVILTRCDQSKPEQKEAIKLRIHNIKTDIVFAETVHRPTTIVDKSGNMIALDEFKNKKVFAFCGIATPQAFFETLNNARITIIEQRAFDDHHHYTQKDMDELVEVAQKHQAEFILTTEKDRTKLTELIDTSPIPFRFLVVELHFTEGQLKIEGLIESALPVKINSNLTTNDRLLG